MLHIEVPDFYMQHVCFKKAPLFYYSVSLNTYSAIHHTQFIADHSSLHFLHFHQPPIKTILADQALVGAPFHDLAFL